MPKQLLTLSLFALLDLALISASVHAQGVSPVPPSYFGNMLNVPTHPWPTAHIGILRLWDTHTRWARIETSRGVFNWSIFDEYMALAASHNVQVVYNLGQTPQWASSNPYGSCKTGIGQCYAPANMQDFADWGQAVAQHIKNWNTAHATNVVVYYELWNEPNGGYFLGTYAQLAEMSRVIAPAIKSVNPAALISTPANQGRYGYRGLDQFFTAGGVCDFIAFHGYLWHVNGALIWPDDPTWGIADFVNRIRQMEARHGLDLPLWDTEHSFGSVTKDLTSKSAQANFVARFYLNEWETGVKTSVWYGWDFYPEGTMWQSGTTWPDGTAAGTVYSWMVGTVPQRVVTSGAVLSMTLQLANGAYSTAVWTRFGTAAVPTAGFSQYSDLNGNLHPITTSTITVSESPMLLISSQASHL